MDFESRLTILSANEIEDLYGLPKLSEREKRFDLVELVKKMSPIGWRHVNLGGRFKLTHQNRALDIDLMLTLLGDFLARPL